MPIASLGFSSQNNSSNYDLISEVIFRVSDEYSLPATVNFVPNFQITASVNFIGLGTFSQYSLPANVSFGNYSYSLPASINFVQSGTQDFNVNLLIQSSIVVQPTGSQLGEKNVFVYLTINNSLLGGGNIPVYISNNSSFADLKYVYTDVTGYFEFNNLTPGTYTITPFLSGLTFAPSNYTVTITNSNIQLYFNGDGILINQIQTNSNLPIIPLNGCFINQDEGNAGTFSIEGFINVTDSSSYTNIMTVITDEIIASNFRKTVVNK